MDSLTPSPEELQDTSVETLGKRKVLSPFSKEMTAFVNDEDAISVYSNWSEIEPYFKQQKKPPVFEISGPRKDLFFSPPEINCGIVTCGGLCPGLNDVVRTITLTLFWQYRVKKVLGFRYGYAGLSRHPREKPVILTPEHVEEIQHEGGTILGTSRSHHNPKETVDTLVKYKINILFVIGGDGTLSGASDIDMEIKKRNLSISVIGIPKTIDNDIYCSQKTFGFSSAVEVARKSIYAAHEEAKAAWNGVGLVKLMGRDSGFIAAYASLANSDSNFCLIPEVSFVLDGQEGLLKVLERRLEKKHHAVIVVAEGAGQNLIDDKKDLGKDASGNIRYKDIGLFLKEKITHHFKQQSIPLTLKYIDPSYTIRSCPADAFDSTFCILLGQHAVHAGMAGKTNMFIGYWDHHFVHVPLHLSAHKRKKVNPQSDLWQTVLVTTEKVGG
ncbi:6-phosphofructokinase [hydrothermal vent metagenome]|uniref:6-phosphofructokinase n=1 Tax=hydrothermal vent metagenome TaxID=652676 RepID=A0A3B1DL15_9ZZZZ